jgi:hypothetical protein
VATLFVYGRSPVRPAIGPFRNKTAGIDERLAKFAPPVRRRFAVTKAEIAALPTMTPEQLIEGFVRETKLYQLSDVPKANATLENKIAFVDEIVRRGGQASLEALMANAIRLLPIVPLQYS